MSNFLTEFSLAPDIIDEQAKQCEELLAVIGNYDSVLAQARNDLLETGTEITTNSVISACFSYTKQKLEDFIKQLGIEGSIDITEDVNWSASALRIGCQTADETILREALYNAVIDKAKENDVYFYCCKHIQNETDIDITEDKDLEQDFIDDVRNYLMDYSFEDAFAMTGTAFINEAVILLNEFDIHGCHYAYDETQKLITRDGLPLTGCLKGTNC